jgi:hypothetical protein
MLTKHAALIHTMVLISAVDTRMKDIELGLIGRLVKYLPVFRDFDVEKLPETAQGCAVILQMDDGLDRELELISASLTPHLRETAYALACEIAAIDHRVPFEELRLLHRLRMALKLDPLLSTAIERTTIARLATA